MSSESWVGRTGAMSASTSAGPPAVSTRHELRNWLLWRTEAGAPVAMRNRCPHRSFPLARGKLVGDRLICGYHGMEFGPDGVCTHMPALTRAPSTAIVHTYPMADS